MKYWMVRVMILAVVAVMGGCSSLTAEKPLTSDNKEEGVEQSMEKIETIETIGTPLDKKPAVTALATFALG